MTNKQELLEVLTKVQDERKSNNFETEAGEQANSKSIWFLLKQLLSGDAEGPSSEVPIRLTGSGEFRLMVVGEASYQNNIERICGGRTTQSVDRIETAHLILEDSNPYDRNAVLVQIDGLNVGYLNREDAKAYRMYLQINGQPNAIGTCHASIRGGWKRSKNQGHFGVRLDFDLYR